MNDDARRRVDDDPDYIAIGHRQNSLTKLKERYPDEVPPHIVAKALARTEKELRALYAATIRQIRKLSGVTKSGE